MLKVVLVEDEPLVRQGLALAVDWASMGCVVVGEAEDGEEGCRVARKTDPDLILTDVRMPRMDGISMIARLRQEGCRVLLIAPPPAQEGDWGVPEARPAGKYFPDAETVLF